MPPLKFTDDDRAALIELLRETIAADPRFPLSLRIKRLKAILDKLDPPGTRPEPRRRPSRQHGP